MRPTADEYFMEMARLVSSRSTCVRRAVGCVLVDKRNHVLATGYNGVPRGTDHCNDVEAVDASTITGRFLMTSFPHACEGASETRSGSSLDACYAVHAEQNAILQCPDANAISKAYVTAFPCTSCAKLLLNTSCNDIVYDDEYGNSVGMRLWVASGRLAVQFAGEPHMIQRDLVRLFGEDDPLSEWRVLVACVCLNLCSARVARGVVLRVLERWPSPNFLAMAEGDLEALLKPLGLSGCRAENLRGMSAMWGKIDLEDLPGVGPYAVESVRVFCRSELPEVVGDRKVAAWVAWARARKP